MRVVSSEIGEQFSEGESLKAFEARDRRVAFVLRARAMDHVERSGLDNQLPNPFDAKHDDFAVRVIAGHVFAESVPSGV